MLLSVSLLRSHGFGACRASLSPPRIVHKLMFPFSSCRRRFLCPCPYCLTSLDNPQPSKFNFFPMSSAPHCHQNVIMLPNTDISSQVEKVARVSAKAVRSVTARSCVITSKESPSLLSVVSHVVEVSSVSLPVGFPFLFPLSTSKALSC